VWAAGVKAADFLKDIAGLETTRSNQLLVQPTLQTTRDDDIFVIGDCAACPWPEANAGQGGIVPPRAQAAHQQATHVVGQIKRRLAGQPLKTYRPPGARWGSVVGPQRNGLTVFTATGRTVRFPAWSTRVVLMDWITRRGIYKGVRS